MATDSRIQAVERATHRSWDEWLAFMDSINAKELTHHEIATKVLGQLIGSVENPGWWTQATTVAYEQYIGRRIPGQRPDGTFQTSVSKATKLGMQALIDAWTDFAAKDETVQRLIKGEVRVSGTDRRITWRTKGADGSSIMMLSEPKGDTASVVIQLGGLKTQDLNSKAKETWAAIVQRFVASL